MVDGECSVNGEWNMEVEIGERKVNGDRDKDVENGERWEN